MVVLCTVTELTCNISFGSTASLCSLSMEKGKQNFSNSLSMFFFENDCHQVKSSFILNMDLDKSGIVFLFRPFCLLRAIHMEKFIG